MCSRTEEDAVEGVEQESVWDSRPTEGNGWLMPVGKAIVVPGLCAREEESGDADEVLARAPESEAVLLEAGDPLAIVDFCPSAKTELLAECCMELAEAEIDEDEEVGEVIFSEDPVPCLPPEAIIQRRDALALRFPAADRTVLENLSRLMAVFETAAKAGLSFKLTKSQLLQPELRLLGTITGRHGQSPDPAKVQGIQDFPPPTSKTQLREFFGSVNWLRPFLSSAFARDSAELRKYLRNNVSDTFELDAAGLASFRAIQKLVTDFIGLGVPDYAAAAD